MTEILLQQSLSSLRKLSPMNIPEVMVMNMLLSKSRSVSSPTTRKVPVSIAETLFSLNDNFFSTSSPIKPRLSTLEIWFTKRSIFVQSLNWVKTPAGMDVMALWWRWTSRASAGMSRGTSVRFQCCLKNFLSDVYSFLPCDSARWANNITPEIGETHLCWGISGNLSEAPTQPLSHHLLADFTLAPWVPNLKSNCFTGQFCLGPNGGCQCLRRKVCVQQFLHENGPKFCSYLVWRFVFGQG